MVSRQHLLISCLLFELTLFPLVALTFNFPNVKNPMTDLISQTTNGYGIAGGTTTSINDTITSQAQAQSVESCIVGALPGIIAGGMLGTAIPIIGTIGGFIAGALVGGGLGCLTASNVFPQQGSSVFDLIASHIPVVGDFLESLAVALSFLGPLLAFASDSVNYEFALVKNVAVIGVFLAPVQIITTFLLFYEVALFIRGLGSTG